MRRVTNGLPARDPAKWFAYFGEKIDGYNPDEEEEKKQNTTDNNQTDAGAGDAQTSQPESAEAATDAAQSQQTSAPPKDVSSAQPTM